MALNPREKRVVIGGSAALALLIAFQAVLRPALDRIETLKRVVPVKQAELTRLRSGVAEYAALRGEVKRLRGRIAGQRKDFGVLTFLEGVQKACGLADRVAYMKPATVASSDSAYVETRVEIKIENVSLRKLTLFLARIDSNEALVGVRSLHIRTAAKESALDAVVRVTSLTPAGRPPI